MRDLLRQRAEMGNTLFVSSHLLSEVEHLADEIVVINRGKLVASGAISDLQQAVTTVRTPTPEQVSRILAAAILAGGLSAVLGAGIGALVRDTGGAVVGAVLVLLILPPLAIQLASGAASRIPGTLVSVLSGVVADPELPGSLLALAAWSLVPAVIGLAAVQKRDVV